MEYDKATFLNKNMTSLLETNLGLDIIKENDGSTTQKEISSESSKCDVDTSEFQEEFSFLRNL